MHHHTFFVFSTFEFFDRTTSASSLRDAQASAKPGKEAISDHHRKPEGVYSSAVREILPGVNHATERHANNRVEVSHQSYSPKTALYVPLQISRSAITVSLLSGVIKTDFVREDYCTGDDI